MARTPAFGFLARAIALARDADARQVPVADSEASLTAQAAAASRRQFLRASAQAATAAALAGCASVPAEPASASGAEVIVVGAGIAGLVATHRLKQAGVPVRLHEAQARIGGRMWSANDRFGPGQVVELGAELIDTPHVQMRALAEEFGLVLDDFTTDLPMPEAEVWHFGGRRYTTAEVAEAFRPVAAAIVRDMAVFDDALLPSARDPERGRALDGLSISDWLTRNGVGGWLKALIEVAYTTEMGLDCDEQSALNLLSLIGTDPGEFVVFGASDERYHVRGGNDLIVRRLADRVADRLEPESRLVRLALDGTGGGYRLIFERGGVAREVRASHVVLALPFTLLRQVQIDLPLPPATMQAIRGLRYGSNAKLMIGFGERIWRTRHGSTAASFSDLPYQTSWETTRLQGGAGGVLVNFVGGRHGVAIGQGSAAEQAERTVADLERLYPGLAATRAGQSQLRMHWPSNPYVLGSYSCYQPGDWTRYRGIIGEPVGRLHFAGEHASFDNWGFMEGAAETGTGAAAAIAAEVGRGSLRAGLLARLARGST
jgi:monoamine oxidase